MKYLNEQVKNLYGITDSDYQTWCVKNDKPMTYKSSIEKFLYKMRTGRLVKDSNGKLIVKKPRGNKR